MFDVVSSPSLCLVEFFILKHVKEMKKVRRDAAFGGINQQHEIVRVIITMKKHMYYVIVCVESFHERKTCLVRTCLSCSLSHQEREVNSLSKTRVFY